MSDVIEVAFPYGGATGGEIQEPLPEGYKLHRRWDRAGRLFGEAGMARLEQAHVMVFGLGGVGSFAAESLVRSGVGKLTLIDFDTVCVTNTNRQLHCLKGAYGKGKAALMAERCQQISPDAAVEAVPQFYNADTSATLLPPDLKPTFVVDAIDNMKAKLHLLHTCVTRGIPVISAMGAAGRMDPTQVRVGELCDTFNDPFAKDVRKLLRLKWGVETGVPCGIRVVFSSERRRDPQTLSYDHGAGFLCVCPTRANDFNSCEHKNQIDGSASFVTGTFGMVAASAVVRSILGVK